MSQIRCPRCSKQCTTRLRRFTTGLAGGMSAGLMYVFLFPFCQPTYCPEHGQIPLTEFTENDRRYMRRRTTMQLTIVIVSLIAAILLVVFVVS